MRCLFFWKASRCRLLLALAQRSVVSAAIAMSSNAVAGAFDFYGEDAILRSDDDLHDKSNDQWTWHLRYFLFEKMHHVEPFLTVGRDVLSADETPATPRPYWGLGLRFRPLESVALFADVVRTPIICLTAFPCDTDPLFRRRILATWSDSGTALLNLPSLGWAGYAEAIAQSSAPTSSTSGWLRSTFRLAGQPGLSLSVIPLELAAERAAGRVAWTHADVRGGLLAEASVHSMSLSLHATRMIRRTFLDQGDTTGFYWRGLLAIGGYL